MAKSTKKEPETMDYIVRLLEKESNYLLNHKCKTLNAGFLKYAQRIVTRPKLCA